MKNDMNVNEYNGRGIFPTIKRLAVLVLLGSSLSACAFLKPASPPPLIYDISAPENLGKGRKTRAQILVKEPAALKFLDSERIVVRLGDTIEYLPVASWSDSLPAMVQSRIVDTFENSKRAGAVAKPGDGLVIDYQILSDIRAFEIVADANSKYAHVKISAKLLNDSNGRVIRSKVFSAKQAVNGDDNASYVAAIDRAFDQVAKALLNWAL